MIRYNSPEDGHAISTLAGVPFNERVDIAIARTSEDGTLLGGVIFNSYTGASIQIHMAGFRDNWANRDILWCAFHYPFVQLGCRKLFAQVPETNTKALEIDLRLGFKIITKIDDVYPDGGVYVLSMVAADCKWLSVQPRHVRSLKEP